MAVKRAVSAGMVAKSLHQFASVQDCCIKASATMTLLQLVFPFLLQVGGFVFASLFV